MLSTELSGGGAERVTHFLASHFPDSVCVVFNNRENIVPVNFRLHVLPLRQSQKWQIKFVVNFLRLLFIQWWKVRYRPDVTISHLEGPNFLNLLTIGGGKRVIVVHNSLQNSYGRDDRSFARLKLFISRLLYSRADRAVIVSPDIAVDLVDLCKVPAERVKYVPNPIDTIRIQEKAFDKFGDLRDELLELPFLISVASLTRQKNHELLIRVFHRLSAELPDLRLFLLGEGDQEALILGLCAELGLKTFHFQNDLSLGDSHVFFLGFQSNPYPFLQRGQMVVMPSLWEGLPIAMLEAMSLKTPIIISDCSTAVRQTLIPEARVMVGRTTPDDFRELTLCGYLMKQFQKPNDPSIIDAWAEAISTLLGDRVFLSECGTRAQKLAGRFDITHSKTIWTSLIGEITGKEI